MKSTPYFNTPKYNDWRRSETNSKKKDLSSAFPVYASKFENNGIQIEFQNDNGQRITFYLPELEANLLLLQIDKLKGRNTTRQDYNLDKLETERYENRKNKDNQQKYIKP